jgi:predicted nucleic-acid-binding Zn-ribbon protein
MTDTTHEALQEYIAMPILCLTCGFNENHPVKAQNGFAKVDVCRCPKCSKKAYVLNPLRLHHALGAIGKEIVRLKMDMIDVQGALDDD